jgi:hypothetical protein
LVSDVATATREYDEPISIPTAINVSVEELMVCIIVVDVAVGTSRLEERGSQSFFLSVVRLATPPSNPQCLTALF